MNVVPEEVQLKIEQLTQENAIISKERDVMLDKIRGNEALISQKDDMIASLKNASGTGTIIEKY
jgi:hypothetical protein